MPLTQQTGRAFVRWGLNWSQGPADPVTEAELARRIGEDNARQVFAAAEAGNTTCHQFRVGGNNYRIWTSY